MRIAVLIVLAAASFARAGDPITVESLMKELADPNAIARFPDPAFKLIQSSSYDPVSKTPDDAKSWFANDDSGKFIRVDERDGRKESVMLDIDGPGAVVRVWSPNPKGVMRVYIDGGAKPIIEAPMEAVFDGTTFFGDAKKGFPLAGSRSRGWNLFVPIPFAKHCLITTDEGKGVYYQVNWRKYGNDARVESCTIDAVKRFGSLERVPVVQNGIRPMKGTLHILEPGDSYDLHNQEGSSGCVRELILTVIARNRNASDLAKVVLRVEVDGARTVDRPLTEFFSTVGETDAADARRCANAVHFASKWPMPFQRSARLLLVNLGETAVGVSGSAIVDPWTWDSRSMHFHATWHRDSKLHTRPMRDFRFVTIEGQGVFAGDSLHVVNPVDAWWGEGDEKIYVDGESFPSSFGRPRSSLIPKRSTGNQ